MRGFAVDDNTLATEVIARVGPGGHFLDDNHTLKHLRTEFWQPKLIDRSRRENWEKAGTKIMGQRTREKVIDIIENFEPSLLANEDKLKEICTRADELCLRNVASRRLQLHIIQSGLTSGAGWW